MYKLFFLIALCFSVNGFSGSYADGLVKACEGKISQEEAKQSVVKAYRNCYPGKKVKINDKCEIRCLKENEGVIIGRG